jgi:hypothetical protein
VVEKIPGKGVEKILLVTVNVGREAYDRAKELGIKIICRNIIN